MNKSDKLGFREYFGTATMGLTDGMAAALMTSFFLLYLTDYAGLGAFGAVVGSSELLFSRIGETDAYLPPLCRALCPLPLFFPPADKV